MTKDQLREELKKAKDEAVKNPPEELKEYIIDTRKSKNKKSSHRILMEMRYGC